jgi:hypothetical protein
MEIEIVEVTNPYNQEITEHVIIRKSECEFTSMLKSTWDELEAAKENGPVL